MVKLFSNRRATALATSAAAVVMFSGCAAFRSGEDTQVKFPPSSGSVERRINVNVTSECYNNGVKENLRAPGTEWRNQVALAFKDSGLFSRVSTNDLSADYLADVNIYDKRQYSEGMWALSLFTALIIPSRTREIMVVDLKLRDQYGRDLGVYRAEGAMTTWYEVALILLTPFYPPDSQLESMLYDLSGQALRKAMETNDEWRNNP